MIVDIQGGGNGVYANSGSCSAAAMYCEHERQELMNKGMKPETFFHQYSDYVSTGEVIDRIDHNKKHLRKEDAKFFVMTVNPSVNEQKQMGDNLEDRIAAFKNYIRNGVMAQYAENFGRGLSANDIMYYAYVHVDRGKKEGEQMHAHIIVSRRDMGNKISLSPKTNHRGSKGVIAHGFNREQFSQKCERAFDMMMDYSRKFEESYDYYKGIKSGDHVIREQLAAKIVEQELIDVDLNALNKYIQEKLNPQEITKTDITEQSSTIPNQTTESNTVVSETMISEDQPMDLSIVGFIKKALNLTAGLFTPKTEKEKTQLKMQPIGVDIQKNGNHYELFMIRGDKYQKNSNVSKEDAAKFDNAKKSGDVEEFSRVCQYLNNKYLKDIPELPLAKQEKSTPKQATTSPVIPKPKNGLSIFKAKGKDYYSAVLYHNGKRCRYIDRIDNVDVISYFKAKKSNNEKYLEEVSINITAKYFLNDLKNKIVSDFRGKVGNISISDAGISFHPSKHTFAVTPKIGNELQSSIQMNKYVGELSELSERELNELFSLVKDLIISGSPVIGVGDNLPPKMKEDKNEKKKKRRKI